MIIGNPDSFSVLFEVIDKWNTPSTSFNNGLLLFVVDGYYFPREVQSATLSRELWQLPSQMRKLVINEALFRMEKAEAFQKLYELVHPREIDDPYNYDYSITPDSFSDHGYYVFAVGNGNQVRVLTCERLDYDVRESRHLLDKAVVRESIIDVPEYKAIAKRIEDAQFALNREIRE